MRNVLSALCALLLCAIMTMTLASCDQMELCWDHDAHTPSYAVNIQADWQLDWQYTYENGTDWQNCRSQYDFDCSYDDLRPARPEGIRAMVYPEKGGSERYNIEAEGGRLNLAEGKSAILLYNNGTEFILFNDIGSSATATATTRTRTRSSYTGSPYTRGGEEQTVNPPDFLFGHYIADYESSLNMVPPTLPVTLRPLVCKYLIRYHFDQGFEHVALARGALAGMAGSVYLTDGHTNGHIVTVLFDIEGSFDQTKNRSTDNCLTVEVNSFGAPHFPNPYYITRGEDDLYGLNLEVMLNNGKVMTFDFDVSEQVRRQPRGGVIDVDGIVITNKDASVNDGFDVNVNGWGEDKIVPIDFGKSDEQ